MSITDFDEIWHECTFRTIFSFLSAIVDVEGGENYPQTKLNTFGGPEHSLSNISEITEDTTFM